MVKSGSSKSGKVEKSASSKSTPEAKKSTSSKLTPEINVSTPELDVSPLNDSQHSEKIVWSLDEEDSVKEDDNDDGVELLHSDEEILYNNDDSAYDNDVARTFIIRDMGSVEERVVKTAHTSKTELVLNVSIVDPIGDERVLIIWGSPAPLVAEYLKYVTIMTTFSKPLVSFPTFPTFFYRSAQESDDPNQKTVYVLPQACELSTEGEPRYIEADASKFLQVENNMLINNPD